MQIAIVGAGTMGTGIAQAAARGGDSIILHDPNDKTLRLALAQISRGLDQGVRLNKLDRGKARLARRAFTLATDFARCAAADLVIEAVPDNLSTKQALIRRLEGIVRSDTIIATTTNTLSITTLASAAQQPQRIIGLHFFTPAHIMRLVEVIRTPHTLTSMLDQATELVRRMDKAPVLVEDTPGWVVNQLAQAYFGEALSLLDSGVSVEIVDRLLEATGFPMGPFRLMDYVGVDRAFEVTQQIYAETFHDAPYRPHARQQRLIAAGRVGRHSPRGGFRPPDAGAKKEL